MRKSELDSWAWYPFKRLTEGKGIIGSGIKRIEEWDPIERLGNPESRKVMPLVRIKQWRSGENEEEKYAATNEEKYATANEVRIPFEHLPKPIKNYAEKEAEKTGLSINEVLHSKPFRNYLLSRLK